MSFASLPTQPYPLGKTCPGANFAAEAVLAIKNIQDAGYLEDGRLSDLVIQAHSSNLLSIYITNDGLPPAADYSNVLRELEPGAHYSAGSPAGGINAVDAGIYYVAAQNATDFAIGEAREG